MKCLNSYNRREEGTGILPLGACIKRPHFDRIECIGSLVIFEKLHHITGEDFFLPSIRFIQYVLTSEKTTINATLKLS